MQDSVKAVLYTVKNTAVWRCFSFGIRGLEV